ncbi:PREDICTED: U3 small nucleolar RNA-associated protein 6 homolog [Prunus mume]|uniref:U3 small nucleolar RNA-associated protein 6 homolog n=1 Tax=Prunus mume TaxID=102107 RepID=A0ABM0NMI9_PRUMU|nr:PREDICTED: U3 small nucleolar RNA-associated protein 6 homolog [Prunus mume]XP_008227019.1 PREDICTED: U3 small nucleolar RNA-associated protein 6 homolog [Prunus mume]
MADVVQYRLERMINELDDLEQRMIFTRREIAEIVKQRRKFEYRLKRPSPLKEDYLAYIEYETQLDSLRGLRKKSVMRELQKQGLKTNKKMKKSVSDFAGVRRIVDIYRLAVMRFKGDIELWFRYLEFCRERRHGRMKKVLAQVIRFHPKVPGVWIYAAAWEFDHNLNVEAARAIMQSGLRVCPTSEDLWIEYLRMELTFLNKLKARKVALGENVGILAHDQISADEKQWRDENKDLYMPLNEEGEHNEGSDIESEKSRKKIDKFQEQGFSILRTIYSGAVEALPSSFSMRKKFLEILDATDLVNSEEMHKEILSDIKRDFSTQPEYWDWLARLEYNPATTQEISEENMHTQVEKAVQVYEEAVELLPSAIMFNQYAKFFMGVTALLKGENKPSGLASQSASYISHLLRVYEKAETMGCIDEDLACQHISFYLQLGRLDEARKLAEKLCRENFSSSAQLCLLRVSVEVRHLTRDSISPSKAELLSIFELLKDALTRVSTSEAESLWLMALKIFANQKHYFEKLVEISVKSLAKDGGPENGFSLSSAIVNFVLQKDGVRHARDVYKRFLALPHPGLAIYRTCIELESNLASNGDKDSLVNARKLYESALKNYDQNLHLWRDYYCMETKMGTSETASAVYWRARKILKDSSALVTQDL